jgi:hypothetical protein
MNTTWLKRDRTKRRFQDLNRLERGGSYDVSVVKAVRGLKVSGLVATISKVDPVETIPQTAEGLPWRVEWKFEGEELEPAYARHFSEAMDVISRELNRRRRRVLKFILHAAKWIMISTGLGVWTILSIWAVEWVIRSQ